MTFALLTAVAGISLSLFARSRIARAEAETARLTAETLRQHTEQELQLFVDVLESVRALHALSEAINQEAMNEFIEKGLVHQHEVLGAFGLIQQISPDLRAAIESKTDAGPGTYRVVQKGADGTWIPAGEKPAYYPLTWQSRTDALKIPIGFDFGSEENIHSVMMHIGRTRKTELVPTPIPNDQQSSPSYWVLAPVTPRYAPRRVIGFAAAILRPQTVLNKVTSLSVHSPNLQLTPTSAPIKENTRFDAGAWRIRQPMTAVGTQWVFECSLPVGAGERRSTAAFAFGIVITTLMTVLILILAERTRQIEAEVLTRTEELRIANQQLEQHTSERAQMEEEMNELAAREQRRIGRDLHDSLGQKLTGAVFLSRSLLNHFDTNNHMQNADPQISHAKTLNETLKDAVSQVRNMARGLASVHLNEENLDESLDQLAEEMSGLYNIPCRVSHSDTLPALSRKTKEQLYFIAREAVNNAAKHAKATRITISLSGNKSGWSLCIEDDGIGLTENQPQQADNEGMGLRTMRHRARRIGAELCIDSISGRGTQVTAKSK